MMKKTITYLIIFAIISFFGDAYLKNCIAQQDKNESPYRLAFASVGANLLESRIDCWATIKTDGSQNQMNQMLIQLLQHLNLPAETDKILPGEINGIKMLEYELVFANSQYYFLIQSDWAGNNINVLITVVDQDDKRLLWYESKLRQLYDFNVYYQYKGIIDARPDSDGREELLNIFLTNLQANTISNYREGLMSSRTGYSQALPSRATNIGGDDINLQAVVRLNTENKTEIYLGSPLLLIDY